MHVQDVEGVNLVGYKASVTLALQRMDLYKEDAESAKKLTKEKGGKRKKDRIEVLACPICQ